MADDLRAEHNGEDRRRDDGIGQSLDRDPLDLELDAALARYAAVEPRSGLEDRVLANLRAERNHAPSSAWWQWTAVAALAVLLVALTLLLRSGERRRDIAHYPSHTTQDAASNGARVARHHGNGQIRTSHPVPDEISRAHVLRHPGVAVASGPRLDQFPSPQPLSEQEKILESYISQYPENAALVARARADALEQDISEEMRGSTSRGGDAQQSNR
jgi:hypothetical protein